MNSHIYCNVIHNNQDMETTYEFIYRKIDRDIYVYKYK